MKPLAPLIRANNPSGNPGVNFMGGIHPRLKRPVGRRLAVAAQALISSKGKQPLTGPTIVGCTHKQADTGAGTLTLTFNASLLGNDEVLVQDFNTNMSTWQGVDSLTAMVCGGAPPPSYPAGLTCQKKCEAAGHCARGLVSCDQLPSCGQGCEVAAAGASLAECKVRAVWGVQGSSCSIRAGLAV